MNKGLDSVCGGMTMIVMATTMLAMAMAMVMICLTILMMLMIITKPCDALCGHERYLDVHSTNFNSPNQATESSHWSSNSHNHHTAEMLELAISKCDLRW